MWRRCPNSVTLANATHRELGKVADGTSTQVRVQMINRCRVKRNQKGLYKVGDSPQKGGGGRGKERKNFGIIQITLVFCLGNLYERMPPWI